MKLLRALFLVSVAATTTTAAAQQSTKVFGYSAVTCGSWSKQRHDNPSDIRGLQAWIAGVFWGVAMTGSPKLLIGADNDAVSGWIDSYCSGHPLQTLGEATVALVKEIMARNPN
jgi:hypothetical protein